MKTSDIFLDISDGQGTGRFNKGSFENLLVFGEVSEGSMEGTAIYPVTFSEDLILPDNNYGFSVIDSAGNKSAEAVRITFDSVDEYGHEILSTM